MCSASLLRWNLIGRTALDQLESAHRAVGGAKPGRRYATRQINQAYVVLLSSQFQRFCRDLHSEVIEYLTFAPLPDRRLELLAIQLTAGRKLDTGNPNPGNIGSDFGRFGVEWWKLVHARSAASHRWRVELETMNRWRNAIAHQDFSPTKLGGRVDVVLADGRKWRTACAGLAKTFDRVACGELNGILGVAPW